VTRNPVWTKDMVREIQRKAETGAYVVRGFGSNIPYPSLDEILIVPAQLHGPPAVDKYREEVRTQVVIGPDLPRPLVLEAPVHIAAMSFGAIGPNGKTALAYGAARMGIATNTGEGGMLPSEKEACRRYGDGKIIVQWSTGRFGVSADYLRAADAVEIKLGQGAKPGMGGHLMAEKVTEEVARIRGIPLGTDALSPCRHLDMDGLHDLANHVKLIREVTDYQVPVLIKLGPADVYEDVKQAVEAGADAVVIDGGEGGTGASPEVASDHAGVPTLGLFRPALRAFEDTRARERGIKLIILGGIRHGADVVKALALGADAVGVATGAMIAMGCTACELCHTGTCPKGIATQDPARQVDVEEAGERVYNYLKAMNEEIKILTALSGHNDIAALGPDDLVATTVRASAVTGLKLIGLDRPVAL